MAIAGQMFRLKERPSPVRFKSPPRLPQKVMMSSMLKTGSIEVPQTSQVHTFLESDVISPVTISKGLRESVEQEVSEIEHKVDLTEQRESLVLLSLNKSDEKEEVADEVAMENENNDDEQPQQPQQPHSGTKRHSELNEQASEVSGGSSITNNVYPLLNSSEVRMSQKTEDSYSKLTMIASSSSRSIKRKFIKLTRAKS